MVDLLDEHFEELQFLWGQREALLRSPRHTLRTLRSLEDRIEAHLQGLNVGADYAAALVRPLLFEDDHVQAGLAGYVLLHLDRPDSGEQLLAAFLHAKGGQLTGLRRALCLAPIEGILPQLRRFLAVSPIPVQPAAAAAVGEVLAFHGKLDMSTQQLDGLLRHADPAVRRAGWRMVKFLALARPAVVYQVGISDGDAVVRQEAVLAAAWGRQPWISGHLRKLTMKPSVQQETELLLLATLAKSDEVGYLLTAGRAAELGPLRFRVLGALGHPTGVELLLPALESKDPLTAVAAGAAFSKITGMDIASGPRVTVPPADGHEPDEFEREFLDEVTLPNPSVAQGHWDEARDRFFKGQRWCRGHDLSRETPREVLAELDLESRWEACLRGKFNGTWKGSPAELEAFGSAQR